MECLERVATAAAGSVDERESIFTMMILLLEAGTMALTAAALVVSRTAAMTMLLARWAYSVTRPRPIPKGRQMAFWDVRRGTYLYWHQ